MPNSRLEIGGNESLTSIDHYAPWRISWAFMIYFSTCLFIDQCVRSDTDRSLWVRHRIQLEFRISYLDPHFRQILCKCESSQSHDQLVCEHVAPSEQSLTDGRPNGCQVGGVVVSPGSVILIGKCRYCR